MSLKENNVSKFLKHIKLEEQQNINLINMKTRNSWKSTRKQWDKISLRLRLGAVDFITIEVDKSRDFYMFTLLNFTVKNR
jgi:hypothetical protein